jgi:hypothetical protein
MHTPWINIAGSKIAHRDIGPECLDYFPGPVDDLLVGQMDCCPNVMLHRRSKDDLHHPITPEDLVRLLKAQLDENIDNPTKHRWEQNCASRYRA